MKWLALASLLLLTSCASAGDDCTWVGYIVPDDGFETRWTEGEMRQAVEHNEKVEELCR